VRVDVHLSQNIRAYYLNEDLADPSLQEDSIVAVSREHGTLIQGTNEYTILRIGDEPLILDSTRTIVTAFASDRSRRLLSPESAIPNDLTFHAPSRVRYSDYS
jgi:hypothetical protein